MLRLFILTSVVVHEFKFYAELDRSEIGIQNYNKIYLNSRPFESAMQILANENLFPFSTCCLF